MTLSPNDLLNLLAVRALRDHAAALARVSDAIHRQVTVILLDAAIERAIFTACDYRSIPLADNVRIDVALQALGKAGWLPEAGIESDRKRLHRARNGSQHAGLDAAPDSVPLWVSTTDRFVDQLLFWAYGVHLDDVRHSLALATPGVGQHFDAADRLLQLGDAPAAMREIDGAYATVNATWSKFVDSTNHNLQPRQGSYMEGFGPLGSDDTKLLALKDITVATAISPEPAEALWYLEARKRPDLLNNDEVLRAQRYVFGFAIAVEASPATQMRDRIRRHQVEARHVRENPRIRPTIASFERMTTGPRVAISLHLQDVPDEQQYDAWAEAMRSLLCVPELQGTRAQLNEDGTIWFDATDEDIQPVLEAIERAVQTADSHALAQEQQREQEERLREEQLRRFRDAFNQHLPADLPAWLSLDVPDDSAEAEPRIVARFSHPALASMPLNDIANILAEALDSETWIGGRGWELVVLPEDLPAATKSILQAFQPIISRGEERHRDEIERARGVTGVLLQHGYRENHPTRL